MDEAFAETIDKFEDFLLKDDTFSGSLKRVLSNRDRNSAAQLVNNRWDNHVRDTRKAFISKAAETGSPAAVAAGLVKKSTPEAGVPAEDVDDCSPETASAFVAAADSDWNYSDLRYSYVSLYHLVRDLDQSTEQSLNGFSDELSRPIKQGLLNCISLNQQSNEFGKVLGSVNLQPPELDEVTESADAKDPSYVHGDRNNVMRLLDVAQKSALKRSEKLNSSFRSLKNTLDSTVERAVARYKRESGTLKLQLKLSDDENQIRRLKAQLADKSYLISMHRAQVQLSVEELRHKYEANMQQHVATLLQLIESRSSQVAEAMQVQQDNDIAVEKLKNRLSQVLHEIEKEEQRSAVAIAMQSQVKGNALQQFRASLYRAATSNNNSSSNNINSSNSSKSNNSSKQHDLLLFPGGDVEGSSGGSAVITTEDIEDAHEAVRVEQQRLATTTAAIAAAEARTAAAVAEHMQLLRSEESRALKRLKTMCDNLEQQNDADSKRILVLRKISAQLDAEREQFRKDNIRGHVQRLTQQQPTAAGNSGSSGSDSDQRVMRASAVGKNVLKLWKPSSASNDSNDTIADGQIAAGADSATAVAIGQLPTTTSDITEQFDSINSSNSTTLQQPAQSVADRLQRLKFAMYDANPFIRSAATAEFDSEEDDSEESDDNDVVGQLPTGFQHKQQRRRQSERRRSQQKQQQQHNRQQPQQQQQQQHLDPQQLQQQRRSILPKQERKIEQIKAMFDGFLFDLTASGKTELKYILDPRTIVMTTDSNPEDEQQLQATLDDTDRFKLPYRPSIIPNDQLYIPPTVAAGGTVSASVEAAVAAVAAQDEMGGARKIFYRGRPTFIAASAATASAVSEGTTGCLTNSSNGPASTVAVGQERRVDGSFKSKHVVPASALQEEEDADFYAQNYGLKLAVEQLNSFLNVLTNWSINSIDDQLLNNGIGNKGRPTAVSSTDEGATLITIGENRPKFPNGGVEDEMLTVEALRRRMNAVQRKIDDMLQRGDIARQQRKEVKHDCDAAVAECDRLRNQLLSMVDNVRWPPYFKAGQLQLEIESRKERLQSMKLEARQLDQRLTRKRLQNQRLSELLTHDLENHQKKMARQSMRASSHLAAVATATISSSSSNNVGSKNYTDGSGVGDDNDNSESSNKSGRQYSVASDRVAIFEDMNRIYEQAVRDVHAAPDRMTPEPSQVAAATALNESQQVAVRSTDQSQQQQQQSFTEDMSWCSTATDDDYSAVQPPLLLNSDAVLPLEPAVAADTALPAGITQQVTTQQPFQTFAAPRTSVRFSSNSSSNGGHRSSLIPDSSNNISSGNNSGRRRLLINSNVEYKLSDFTGSRSTSVAEDSAEVHSTTLQSAEVSTTDAEVSAIATTTAALATATAVKAPLSDESDDSDGENEFGVRVHDRLLSPPLVSFIPSALFNK